MHTVSLRDAGDDRRDATFYASFPPMPAAVTATSEPACLPAAAPSRFGARKRPNLVAIGAVGLVHAGLLAALIQMNVIPVKTVKAAPLVVELIAEPPAPPPAPPEAKVEPVKPVEPVVVAPTPIVQTLAPPPPPVAATPTPPPPQAVIVAPKAAPAPATPVSAGDLSSTMLSFKAPTYPVESRRRKEQGIVILNLLLGADGAVSEISVQKSSGFARLDQAALAAVKRWRWSPTLRGGLPMMVRGVVEIPFVLRS